VSVELEAGDQFAGYRVESVLGRGGMSVVYLAEHLRLFECLAGRPTFVASSDVTMVYAHLQDPPPALGSVRPDLPPGLDAVIARAMAKTPGARYATCRSLVQAAEEDPRTGVRLGPAPPPARPATGRPSGP
jgi:hypothetical protein